MKNEHQTFRQGDNKAVTNSLHIRLKVLFARWRPNAIFGHCFSTKATTHSHIFLITQPCEKQAAFLHVLYDSNLVTTFPVSPGHLQQGWGARYHAKHAEGRWQSISLSDKTRAHLLTPFCPPLQMSIFIPIPTTSHSTRTPWCTEQRHSYYQHYHLSLFVEEAAGIVNERGMQQFPLIFPWSLCCSFPPHPTPFCPHDAQ